MIKVGNSELVSFLLMSEDIFCFAEQQLSYSSNQLIKFLMKVNCDDAGSRFVCKTVTLQKTAIFISTAVSTKVI